MTPDELLGLSRAFAPVVADAIKAANAPLLARIAELEKRPTANDVAQQVAHAVRAAVDAMPAPPPPKDIDPLGIKLIVQGFIDNLPKPVDGKDADPELIKTLVADAVAALPVPEPGRDADPEVIRSMVADAVAALPRPRDGQDVDPETVRGMVAEAVAALPPAAPGRDADPEVIRGMVAEAVAALPPARNGRDACPEVTRALIEQQVAEAVAALPPAAPGKDADPAATKAIVAQLVAEAVAAIPAAKDGVGLAGALIDRAGDLILTLTNGETRNLGRVEGKDGEPGRAGFALEDFDVEQPDERTMVLSFRRGETTERYELALGGFIDRGVWKDGQDYELGDAVTWGGALWLCRAPTRDKPEGSDSWRLAVKRGRDGNVDPVDLQKRVEAAVVKAVAALPKSK